jgi:hypothetical protein
MEFSLSSLGANHFSPALGRQWGNAIGNAIMVFIKGVEGLIRQ